MRSCVNPQRGEPPTGEPDAGDLHVRFGGRGNEINRLSLPLLRRGLRPAEGLYLYFFGAMPLTSFTRGRILSWREGTGADGK